MKGHLSAKDDQDLHPAQTRLVEAGGELEPTSHTVGNVSMQHAVDLHELLGQACHCVAHRSRKIKGFAAELMKRERERSALPT